MLDRTELRGDEGAGDRGSHSGWYGYNGIVESDVPGSGPLNIGSSLNENSCSVDDLEPTLEDQELRLDMNGSDIIEPVVFSLRWVTLSGNVRLLLPSKLLSRVVGTRNTSLASRRAGSQKPGFRNIASFSWRRMTRSKVRSSTWDMMTQVIIDRQYAGKNDPEFMLINARIEVAHCSRVIAEANTNCR